MGVLNTMAAVILLTWLVLLVASALFAVSVGVWGWVAWGWVLVIGMNRVGKTLRGYLDSKKQIDEGKI